jgi:hypothetical protein
VLNYLETFTTKARWARVTGSYLQKHLRFVVFFILCGLWIPLLFLNFDPHHDGLILTTVRLTEAGIHDGGQYPFNQYGASWILPFLLAGAFVSDDYLFLALRITTVALYFVSTFLLIRVARFFLPSSKAWITGILFLSAQPFVSDLGSDLVPWPSAIVMPLVISCLYFSLKSFKETTSSSLFWVGFLFPFVLLSRFQIGVLTGFSIIVLLILHRSFRSLGFVAVGFCASGTAVAVTLLKLNWLQSAFYDQIIFGLTYLSADKSTFPKPVITFIGVIFVAAIIKLAPLILSLYFKANTSLRVSVLVPVLSLSALTAIFLISQRDLSFLNLLVVATRRFWIILVLGSLFYFFISMLGKLYKNSFSWVFANRELCLLGLFAVSLQSQTYPLFDQMHFWWGSPLSFLVATIIFRDSAKQVKISEKTISFLKFIFTFFVVLSLVIPWIDQVTKEKYAYPKQIGSSIFSSRAATSEQRELQLFFSRNMPPSSRVLNLCDDTNVFFGASTFIPASRFFVFWGEQMSHADQIFSDMKNSNPDFIVKCDLTHAPALRDTQEAARTDLINSFPVEIVQVGSFIGIEKKKWDILQIKK